MTAHPPCTVCASPTSPFDTGTILGRHQVTYYRCSTCGLVFLANPTWLDEAYENPISDGDTGLLRRCRILSTLTGSIIRAEGARGGRFLDWAGGYGILTRLMRDKGLDFWHHDPYATPVFARDHQDDGTSRYDLVTAFEVLEHLADPRAELREISQRTDKFLFSTMLLPDPVPRAADWWYFDPEVGQHITFHTRRSLELLGAALGYELLSNGKNWHLFHRGPVSRMTRLILSQQLPPARDVAASATVRLRERWFQRQR